MYARNSTLYQNANIARIDRFIANKALDFVKRCADSQDENISNLARSQGTNDPKYLPVAFWAKWHSNETLLSNDEIRIFNQSQRGVQRQVYSSGQ